MKVGIIAANNIRLSPYIFFYTELLQQIGVNYELIYPDRNGIMDHFDGVVHVMNWDCKQKTAINYARYAQAVSKVIRQQKYDALIILTSVNAAYLSLWLKKHYKGKYIVDIRDYTHENIYPYFLLQGVAVRNSLMNIISSKKFTSFLPQAEYSVCHNYSKKDVDTVKANLQKKYKPVTIGYVGALSYVDQCKELMRLVANDSRFALEFYGSSSEENLLRKYAETLSCDSIHFHGAYTPSEKGAIIESIDILFNAYGNGIPLLDCALSNKLYDALIYKKPILTCHDTYMAEMAGPLSFCVDLPNMDSLDQLYEWYTALDPELVNAFAEQTMYNIQIENGQTLQKIAEKLHSIL